MPPLDVQLRTTCAAARTVGYASLTHPTNPEVASLARRRNPAKRMRQINTTGKIPLNPSGKSSL
jgi:hypothetical protein